MSLIYFLSDAHIRGGSETTEALKQNRLVSFLRSLSSRAEILYIVGDLFDFWFEYRSVIPRHGVRIVCELYQLVQAGVQIRYLPGNHDPWIGSFFSREIGVEVIRDPVSVTHQRRHLYIDHGDLIYSPERRYRLVRAILQNPACIWLFSLLHPDMGDRLARVVSTSSRGRNYSSSPCFDRYFTAARKRFAAGYDLVIFGHVHVPLHQALPGGEIVVLGDWEQHFTYAVLQEGEISLRSWGEHG